MALVAFAIVGDMSRASEFEDELVAFFQLTKQMQVPLVAMVEYSFYRGRFQGQDVFAPEHGFGGLDRVFQRRSVYEFWGCYRVCWGVRDECRGGFILVVATSRWETLQLLHQTMPFAAAAIRA